MRLPAQAEPGQIAQLNGPGDGVGGNQVLVVEKRHESIVIGDGHMPHPVEGGLGRGKENEGTGPCEEGYGESE